MFSYFLKNVPMYPFNRKHFHGKIQELSGRVLDSRPWGCGFEPHLCHCVLLLRKNISPSLVLVQPRKTRPFITERLLMGRKESNQTNHGKIRLTITIFIFSIAHLLCSYLQRQCLGPVTNTLSSLKKQYRSLAQALDTTRHQVPTTDIYLPDNEEQYQGRNHYSPTLKMGGGGGAI